MESAKGIVVKRREYLGFFLPPFFVGAANATDCLQHQVQELAPVIINPKTAVKKAEVCYEAFAVEHSGITRAPPWPAKHLVRGNIESEQSMISYPVCHSASKTWRQTLNLLHRTMKATTPVRREKIGMFHERPLRMTTVAHQQIKRIYHFVEYRDIFASWVIGRQEIQNPISDFIDSNHKTVVHYSMVKIKGAKEIFASCKNTIASLMTGALVEALTQTTAKD